MPPKTLQLATIGEDTEDALVGIRNFPTHKLVLVCFKEHRDIGEKLKFDLERTLRIPVEVYPLEGNIIDEMLKTVANILKKDGKDYDDIILNVGGGDKTLTCAATTTAFINGLKAFHCKGNMCVMLPVMKLGYSDLVSGAKVEILKAIDKAGGQVESLEQLSEISGYGKPLLSYHVQGAEDSRGLAELGLVEVERAERGRLRIRLNTLGRLLIQSR